MNTTEHIKNIAVTGTNGKTTCMEFARQLLKEAGYTPASYGTLGLLPKSELLDKPLLIGAESFSGLVKDLRNYEETDVFLFEAYSVSLACGLYDEVPLDSAAFLNLGSDHLSFHGNRKAYGQAKLRCFSQLLSQSGMAIYNLDDPFSSEIRKEINRRGIPGICFGMNPSAELYLHSIDTSSEGTRIGVDIYGVTHYFLLPFKAKFLLYNWMAAIAIAIRLNIDLDLLKSRSQFLAIPAGRLELMGYFNGGEVYVDYAHNPHGFRVVLKELRNITTGKLVVVFGCGGERDRTKRPEMGQIACELADTVIVTDDNPRNEDPLKIRQEIMKMAPGSTEIGDRAQAIEYALSLLSSGDSLLVAGKGHEDIQEIGNQEYQFSDQEWIRSLCKSNLFINN